MNKLIDTLYKIVVDILIFCYIIIILLFLCKFIAVNIFEEPYLDIAGFSCFLVGDGSKEASIDENDILLSIKTDDIDTGDTIAYLDYYDNIIVSRVDRVNGDKIIISDDTDIVIDKDDLIGKCIFVISKYILFSSLIVIFIALVVVSKLTKKTKKMNKDYINYEIDTPHEIDNPLKNYSVSDISRLFNIKPNNKNEEDI